MLKTLIVKFAHLFLFNNFAFLYYLLVKFFIKKYKPLDPRQPNLFLLDEDRYRGDIQCLINEFNIFSIKQSITGSIIKGFYPKNCSIADIVKSNEANLIIQHSKALLFAQKILSYLVKNIKIDAILNVNYRYLDDYAWTIAAENMKIPHIILYRECLLTNERQSLEVLVRHKRMGVFKGSRIIVSNEICKNLFVDSGYAPKSKITVCGTLRMDQFIRKIPNNGFAKNCITVFYFEKNSSLFGKLDKGNRLGEKFNYLYQIWPGRENFFYEYHKAFIELAIDNPGLIIYLKPKKENMRNNSWKDFMKIFDELGVDLRDIPNYKICPNASAENLIFESKLVSSFHSTTTIEAAIAGKRVLLPLLEDYQKSRNFDDFAWRNDLDLFDVAYSAKDIKNIVINSLSDPSVSEEIIEKRWMLFEKYFGPRNRKSLTCYTKVIKKEITNSCV